MTTASDTGLNRTGIKSSPIQGPKTIKGAEEGATTSTAEGDGFLPREERIEQARSAEPIGTVPPPPTLRGMAKVAMDAFKGRKASVLIDKLGERLGFERSGVRLYELVLAKLDVHPSWEGGPTEVELESIQQDELTHMGVAMKWVERLGGDATAMTPSADIAANLSKGVPAVLADPRTDLRQCLEGILVVELSDNAGWETLIALAEEMNQDEMVADFSDALRTEEEHLARVRGWVRAGVMGAAEGRSKGAAEQPQPGLS